MKDFLEVAGIAFSFYVMVFGIVYTSTAAYYIARNDWRKDRNINVCVRNEATR